MSDTDTFAGQLVGNPQHTFQPQKNMGQAFPKIAPPPTQTQICELVTHFKMTAIIKLAKGEDKISTEEFKFKGDTTPVNGPPGGGALVSKVDSKGSLPGLQYAILWSLASTLDKYFPEAQAGMLKYPIKKLSTGATGTYNTEPPELKTTSDDEKS